MSAYSTEGVGTDAGLMLSVRSKGSSSGFLPLIRRILITHWMLDPHFNCPMSCWARSSVGEQNCLPLK